MNQNDDYCEVFALSGSDSMVRFRPASGAPGFDRMVAHPRQTVVDAFVARGWRSVKTAPDPAGNLVTGLTRPAGTAAIDDALSTLP